MLPPIERGLYTFLMRHIFQGRVVGLVVFCLMLVLISPNANADTNGIPCDDPHIATAADIAAGFPPGSQVCPQDYETSGVTPQSGEAKGYLRSILCAADGDNYGGMGPDETISGLNAEFSVCAAKFLQAARVNGINVCIREGVRSVAKQEEYVRRGIIACKKGAQCEHPRGIAIDANVFPNSSSCESYKRLHASAPSFGLTFYLGCKDAFHFVPKKGGSCYGDGEISPDVFYDYPQYYKEETLVSSILDKIRQSLGGEEQPFAPIQAQASPAGGALPPQSQPTSAFETTPAPAKTDVNAISTQQQSPVSSSILERLRPYTTQATSSSTTTSFVLYVRPQDSATIQGQNDPSDNAQEITDGPIAYQLTPFAQHTFVSEDLRGSVFTRDSQDMTAFRSILADIKKVLLDILEYLLSLGGANDEQPSQEWR
jgi:hypothetical protein